MVLKITNVPIIAPFFADTDTRGYRSGLIYFRQTEDSALLSRAKQFTFPLGVTFSPSLLYIVTWEKKTGFYNHYDGLVKFIIRLSISLPTTFMWTALTLLVS